MASYNEPKVWAGVSQSTNRPHVGSYIVYINGIEVPTKSVSQRYGVWQIPEMQIEMVADPVLTRLGTEDRVQVVVFYLDDIQPDPSVVPQFRLFGEGEIVGWGYQNTPGGRSIVFTCVNQIAVLTQLFVQFLTQVDDYSAYSTTPTTSQFGTATSSIVFPHSLFTEGLLRTNTPTPPAGTATPEAGAAPGSPNVATDPATAPTGNAAAAVTGVDPVLVPNAIQRPFDFLFNVIKAMLEKKLPNTVRTIPAANFFARWARLTNFVNHFVGFPVFDEGGDKNVFPALKAIQSVNAVDVLVRNLLPQMQNAGSLFDMLQLVYQQVFMEIAMIPTMPLIHADLKTGIIDAAPLTEDRRLVPDSLRPSVAYQEHSLGIKDGYVYDTTTGIAVTLTSGNGIVITDNGYFDSVTGAPVTYESTTAAEEQRALVEQSVGDGTKYVARQPPDPLKPYRIPMYFSKPQLLFGLPPACNAIFPSQIKMLSYSETFVTQPTRLYFNDEVVNNLLKTQGINNTLISNALATGYPPEVNVGNQIRLNEHAGLNGKNFLLFPEEFFKGPVMDRRTVPPWLFFLAQAEFAKKKPPAPEATPEGTPTTGVAPSVSGTDATTAATTASTAATQTALSVIIPPAALIDRRKENTGIANYGTRDWKNITGITLHHTSCVFDLANIPRWNTLKAHFGIRRDGKILYCIDVTTKVWHAQGLSHGDVGIEMEGYYAGVEGDLSTFTQESSWKTPRKPMSPAAELISASREAVRYIVDLVASHGGRIKYIHAHRQASRGRTSDPGSALWKEVGMHMIEELGLSDGGKGFRVGTGSPIPKEWNPLYTDIPYRGINKSVSSPPQPKPQDFGTTYTAPGPQVDMDLYERLKAEDETVYQLYAKYEYFRERYSRRSGAAALAWNPYVVPGFPAAFFDQRATRVDVFAYITTVQQRMSSRDRATDISFIYGRTIQEMFDLMRHELALGSGILATAPKEPIKDVRKVIQSFSQSEDMYRKLFYGGYALYGKDAAFDWRKIIGYAPNTTSGVPEAIYMMGKEETANDAYASAVQTFNAILPKIEELEKARAIAVQKWNTAQQAVAQVASIDQNVLDTISAPLRLSAAERAIQIAEKEIRSIDAALAPLYALKTSTLTIIEDTEERVSTLGLGVVHNVVGNREIVPLPSAESLFQEYDAAMAYNWRPICTLDEYVIFHDAKGEEPIPATGHERSLGARYFGRIRRMTPLKKGFNFPVGADGFQKMPDSAIETPMICTSKGEEPANWTPQGYRVAPPAGVAEIPRSGATPTTTAPVVGPPSTEEAAQAAATRVANMSQVPGVKSGTGPHGENANTDFPQTRADWDTILLAYRNNVYYVKAPRG